MNDDGDDDACMGDPGNAPPDVLAPVMDSSGSRWLVVGRSTELCLEEALKELGGATASMAGTRELAIRRMETPWAGRVLKSIMALHGGSEEACMEKCEETWEYT